MKKKASKSLTRNQTIVAALITLIGVIITAVISRENTKIPIDATLTAEANLTQLADITTPSFDLSTVTMTSLPTYTPTITPSETPTMTPTAISKIGFQDQFDNPASELNTSLWVCEPDCDSDFLMLINGSLSLHRSVSGYTELQSVKSWKNSDIVSLTGDLRIENNSKFSVGWLRLTESAGCEIQTGEFNHSSTPSIQCNYGEASDNVPYPYSTSIQAVEFGTWYHIRIEFDQASNIVRYYINDKFIAEYQPPKEIKQSYVQLGIWVESEDMVPPNVEANGQVYIDNVLVDIK